MTILVYIIILYIAALIGLPRYSLGIIYYKNALCSLNTRRLICNIIIDYVLPCRYTKFNNSTLNFTLSMTILRILASRVLVLLPLMVARCRVAVPACVPPAAGEDPGNARTMPISSFSVLSGSDRRRGVRRLAAPRNCEGARTPVTAAARGAPGRDDIVLTADGRRPV